MLVAPGVAGAAVTPGDYGGGAVAALEKGAKRAWLTARVFDDGTAAVGGYVPVAAAARRHGSKRIFDRCDSGRVGFAAQL
jgi:hypothetical protein